VRDVTRRDVARRLAGLGLASGPYSFGNGQTRGRSDCGGCGRCCTGGLGPDDGSTGDNGSRLRARSVYPGCTGLVGFGGTRGRRRETRGMAPVGELPFTAECGEARRPTDGSSGKGPHLGRRLAGHLGVGPLATRSASAAASQGDETAVDRMACALRRSRCAP
jgi:hypothetical protein